MALISRDCRYEKSIDDPKLFTGREFKKSTQDNSFVLNSDGEKCKSIQSILPFNGIDSVDFQAVFAKQFINATIYYSDLGGAPSVLVTGPGISGDIASKETYIVICEHIPTGVSLEVTITAPDGSNINYTQMERIPGNLEVCYTPPLSGKYVVEILLNKEHIEDSPFEVQHGDPTKSFATGKGLEQCTVGKVSDFIVNCSNTYTNSKQLIITVVGPNCSISPSITEISEDIYSVQYKPIERGQHTITVLLMGINIKGSPFTSVGNDPSTCALVVPESTKPVLGNHFYFNIETRETVLDATELSMTVTGPQGELPVECYKDGFGDIVCHVTPVAKGRHSIEAKWEGAHIVGSPRDFVATPNVTFTITDKPIGCLSVLKEDCFVVRINREGCTSDGEELAACGSNGEKCLIHPLDNEIDSYAITFTPTKVGLLSIEVTYGNEPISESPVTFLVNDPAKCVIKNFEDLMSSYYVVGDHIDVKVSTTLAGNITTKVNNDGKLFVEQISDNNYVVCLIPRVKGDYQLELFFDGVPIPQSPVKFQVHSFKSHADASKVTLTVPEELVVLKENYILADATQAGSGYLTAYCKCDGFSDIPVEIHKEDKSVEIFKLVITPTQKKIHYLSIYWSDIELPCSPIQIGPQKSTIVVEDPYYCMLTYSLITIVDCTRAGNGTLTAVCNGKSTGSKEVSVEYLADIEKYKVSFSPSKDDEYLLDILFNGKQVPDSPLLIDIKKIQYKPVDTPDYCESSKVFIPAKDTSKLGTAHYIGKSATFQVCTNDINAPENGGKLDLVAQGPGEVQVKIYDNNDLTYTCVLTPSLPGLYHVAVLWNDRPIKNGHHDIFFKDRLVPINQIQRKLYFTARDFEEKYLKPKFFHGFDIDFDGFVVGVPYNFIVDCRDISVGELKVAIKPSNAADIIVTDDCRSKLYKVQITLKSEGNHELLALWCKEEPNPNKYLYGGRHILGSPFVINARKVCQEIEDKVTCRDSVVARGPGLKNGCVGVEGFFTVRVLEDGLLAVNVKGPEGGFKLDMRRLFDTNDYLFRYNPMCVGTYTIDITWSGVHVSGSPFKVAINEQ